MSTIYGTRTTRTGFIIMYRYGFDNISTFFATNFVSDYLHKIPCLIVFKSSYNKHITLSGVHQSLCSIRRLEQQRIALCGLQLFECPCSKLCFLSTHQRKAVLYAVFDPHYFSPEPSQDPYQPLQLRTVTEWKPFSKRSQIGSSRC